MAKLISIKKLINNLSFVIPAEAGIQGFRSSAQ